MRIKINELPKTEIIDLGDNLNDVRKNQDKITLDTDITNLTQQPGTGKSTWLKRYLEDSEEKWLITVPNHYLIENEYQKIKRIRGVKYWQGFDRLCSKYLNDDKLTKLLKDKYKLGAGVICSNVCTSQEMGKCPYRKQFKHSDRVLTVSAYHNTTYFYNYGEFIFDIVLIDEKLTGYQELIFNENKINESVRLIYTYINNLKTEKCFLDIISKKDLFSDISKLDKQEECIKQVSIDQRSAIKVAINQGYWDDVEVMSKLNVYDVRKWLYYYSIHQEDRIYCEPNVYKMFDLARQGIKVVTSDASFSQEIHNAMLGRYYYEDSKIPRSLLIKKELKPVKELTIKRYISSIKDDNTDIYRVWDENYFYKSHLDKLKDDLQYFVNRALRKNPNIGIITYDKKEEIIDFPCDTAHFGNLRGLNTFENKDAVFIIGSFLTPDVSVLKDYNALFLTDYQLDGDVWRPRYKKKDNDDSLNPGGSYVQIGVIGGVPTTIGYSGSSLENKKPEPIQEVPFKEYDDLEPDELQFKNELEKHNGYYVDTLLLNRLKKEKQVKDGEVDLKLLYPVQLYDTEIIESEIYQTIHRARPLLNNNIKIYVFGYIPDSIKNEFKVDLYDKSETKRYFMNEFKTVYPSSLVGSISSYCYRNKSTSLDVAKRFKIHKKDGNYNTPFITSIKKGQISPDTVNKIDKAIRTGKLTNKDIGKRHSGFAVEDAFVDYCIRYATDKKLGGLIQLH